MDASTPQTLPAGVPVVDTNGVPVGRVRAVYPHYLAVETDDDPPAAYRVPLRAIFAFDGTTVSLRVERDALDPMTPDATAADDLPEHGGEVPVGTGTDLPEAAAGFSFGNRQIGDGEPGSRPAEDAAAFEESLARAATVVRGPTAHTPNSDADADVGAATGTDAGN